MLKTPTENWREVLKKFDSRKDFYPNLQYVHTKFILGEEMLDKVSLYATIHPKSTYCTLNLTFVQLLIERGIPRANITFVTDCREKAELCKRYSKLVGVNVIHDNYLTWSTIMKFDVIVGNPPYQTKSDSANRNSQPVWGEFVKQSFCLLKDDGYLCLVHPSGWRDVKGAFVDVKQCLLSKKIKYLEMHSQPDGVKTFGEKTDYDWYVIQNCAAEEMTTVKFHDGTISQVNLLGLPFIPNGIFDEVFELLAKPDEERVNLIHSYSAYECRKPWMSKEKSSEFKYPCAYTVMKKGMKCHYSSRNDNGHFGIPKFIWGNGEINYIGSEVDVNGEYGLTQFCYAIADDPKILPLIKTAFDSPKFKRIMNMCSVGKYSINEKVLALFRKDFWKEFIK